MKYDLTNWCKNYIQSRDAMERKLVSVDDKGEQLLVTYKNRVVTFVPQTVLDDSAAKIDGIVTVVTLQTPANFNILLNKFGEFAKNPNLMVIFVNPVVEEKWLLKPHVHAAVADKSSLKAGLTSLYQTVPPVH